MAIIINEIEVVSPQATPQGIGAPAPAAEGPGGSPPLSPMDIREIQRHQAERQIRVYAH